MIQINILDPAFQESLISITDMNYLVQLLFYFSITVYIQHYFGLVSGVQHSSQTRQSYTLQSVPLTFPVPTWHHTRLLQYYGLYSICCTFHPCDYLKVALKASEATSFWTRQNAPHFPSPLFLPFPRAQALSCSTPLHSMPRFSKKIRCQYI